MSDQNNTRANFEKIRTVTSGYFSYIVGHFHQPDIYVIGAMDLNDPASWSGGETAVVYYFMITPEEYSWLETDPAKLNALAQKIQTNMPKNRFVSATSTKKGMKPEELQAMCEAALKAYSLDDDETFEEWKKTVHFPRRVRVPKTPFNEARHELALCQHNLDPKTATQEQKEEEQDLEKKLGWLIFKAEEIYVAYDDCFNPRFPMVESARGFAHLYSTQELADNSAKFYSENHYYYVTIRKVEQKDIKSFLRTCEEFGITQFRVDDGLEPVTVQLSNIIPHLDRGYIENYNCHIRGLMLRTMQTLRMIHLHGDEMDPKRKAGLNDWFLTWNRLMLQELGKTTLFVPCGLPEKMHDQLEGNYTYTEAGLKNIQNMMEKSKVKQSISRPSFTGKHIVIHSAQEGKLPIRILKTPDEKQWLIAFTSRQQAEEFVKQTKKDDVIVGMTLDELAAEAASTCHGVLLDPASFALSLNDQTMEQALKIRYEKRLIYRSEAAGTAPAKTEENKENGAEEMTDQQPVTGDSIEDNVSSMDVTVPVEGEAPEEIEQTETDGSKKKVGFFSRLFGKDK